MKNDSYILHLEELRLRIIYSLLTIFIFSIISFLFKEEILQFIIRPLPEKPVFISPYGGVIAILKISLGCGFIFSIPFIFYHIWKFISPGLYPSERKFLTYLIITTIFFFLGATFFFFILLPYLIKFFTSIKNLKPMIDINSYISFVILFIIIFGLIFETPFIIIFLVKSGIVTLDALSRKRPLIILIIFILSAIITPPDVISQIIVAFPVIFVFEIGMILSKILTH